jgi:hypothetical protein
MLQDMVLIVEIVVVLHLLLKDHKAIHLLAHIHGLLLLALLQFLSLLLVVVVVAEDIQTEPLAVVVVLSVIKITSLLIPDVLMRLLWA